MTPYNLVSFAGLFILLGVAWLLSSARRTVNWRLIGWAVGLQLLFAAFVFQVPAGTRVFLALNDAVVQLLDCASAGTRFVFGRLALPPGTQNEQGEPSLGFILAFQAFPAIVFFSALMSILYHWRIMPALIRAFGVLFARLMRISGAEAMCASSNIFVGVESAVTVRPYLESMTRSELCAVLTTGMASIASNVLALYVYALKPQFPGIAGHLLSASILSAPAALVMAKLLMPETGQPVTMGKAVEVHVERSHSTFEAVISGANAGVQIIVGIVALLLAVLGLVALLDLVLGFVGAQVNLWAGWDFRWSLRNLLGYAFYPFALVIGVPVEDAGVAARLIGERLVATEVASYQDLATALAQGALQAPGRSAVLIAYALCGFAHLASMAIFVGGTAALAPSRTRDLASVSLRALVAANLACLMTACAAGVFATGGGTVLLGR